MSEIEINININHTNPEIAEEVFNELWGKVPNGALKILAKRLIDKFLDY